MDSIRAIFTVEVKRHLPYFAYRGTEVKIPPCTAFVIELQRAMQRNPFMRKLLHDAVHKR